MGKINIIGVEDVETKVLSDFGCFPKELLVHNANHCIDVAKTALFIAREANLGLVHQKELYFSGLMHDIGLLDTIKEKTYFGHELKGVEYVVGTLPNFGYESLITLISKNILATRMPQSPTSFLEEIICDCDLANFGRDDFFATCANLRIEIENVTKNEIKIKDWLEKTYNLLSSHSYHTDIAKSYFNKKKQENLFKLEIFLDFLNQGENEHILQKALSQKEGVTLGIPIVDSYFALFYGFSY